MLKKALWIVVVFFSLGMFATALDDGHFDASIGWGGVFNKTSSNPYNLVTVAPTKSGVVLGTFEVRFHRMHGLELNIGHTTDSQVYNLGSNDYRVQATVIEYSGAYVFSPFQSRRLEPFLFGGLGGLRFNPGNTYIDGFQSAFGASRQTALAFLYGGGADYLLWRALALRLQYRGLIYKEPTFHLPQFFSGTRGHMAEPSIGVVFKF